MNYRLLHKRVKKVKNRAWGKVELRKMLFSRSNNVVIRMV